MARMIGQATSRMWYLLGALCAMVLGTAAKAADLVAQPEYGIRATPQPAYGVAVRPSETDEKAKAAAALAQKYLAPIEAQTPTDDQKKQIDALVQDLASGDADKHMAAHMTLAKMGPPALGALREAAQKEEKPSAAAMLKGLVKQVEATERGRMAEQLKATGEPGIRAAMENSAKAVARQESAHKLYAQAKQSGDAKAIEAAQAALAATGAQRELADQLLRAVGAAPTAPPPGLIEAKYGVRRGVLPDALEKPVLQPPAK